MALLLSGCAQPIVNVIEDAEWNRRFTRTDGWTCGDIAHSIDLGDGRTLWLFGDSGIGPVVGGRHVSEDFSFIRNATAWHKTPRRGRVPDALTFMHGPASGGRAASTWLEPTPGLWPDGTWYWLMGDGAVVHAQGGREASRLVLFATALGPAGNPKGEWNFRRIGGVILAVENVTESPDRWGVEQRVNPLVQPVARFGEPPRDSDDWGAAVVASPTRDGRSPSFYIYGVRSPRSGPHELLVARCGQATLDRPDRWQFFDGQDWSNDPASAVGIASSIPDEFTIQTVRRNGAVELVLVHSEPLFGRHIFARTAARPEGPWSEPQTVYEVEDPVRDPRLMTYAAKGHAALSRPGELLVSYVVNSSDFAQVIGDASLYRPRFIRVPIQSLPAAPAP